MLHYALLTVRVVLSAFILLILLTKWNGTFSGNSAISVPDWLAKTPPGKWAAHVAGLTMARYLVSISLLGLWVLVRRGYTGELVLGASSLSN